MRYHKYERKISVKKYYTKIFLLNLWYKLPLAWEKVCDRTEVVSCSRATPTCVRKSGFAAMFFHSFQVYSRLRRKKTQRLQAKLVILFTIYGISHIYEKSMCHK